MVNNQPQQKPKHPFMLMVQTLVQKLVQHPEIYPIKYYKKTSRLKKMSALL
jgi:hypothetical protein